MSYFQSVVYDNLYIYHIKNNEWTELIVPNCPPPRCAHQVLFFNVTYCFFVF